MNAISGGQGSIYDFTRRLRLMRAHLDNTLFAKEGRPLWLDQRLQAPDGPQPFNSLDLAYYRSAGRDKHRRVALEQALWAHNAMAVYAGGGKLMYWECAISGGTEAHKLAMAVNHRMPVQLGPYKVMLRTTKDLDKSDAGGERFGKDVIEPNRLEAMALPQEAQRVFPGYIHTFPFQFEGVSRAQVTDTDVNYGRRPEEQDFMADWYMRILFSDAMGWRGDAAFSRNSNWEMMKGVRAAAGLETGMSRADSDFLFFQRDGAYPPLADRFENQLQYLIYALENDFYARESAACLAWILEIDRRLRDPAYNASSYQPLHPDNISSQLKEEYYSDEPWAIEARAKMDGLRGTAEKLLLTHFPAHIDEEHLLGLDERYKRARDQYVPLVEKPEGWKPGDACYPAARSLEEKLATAAVDPADPFIAATREKLKNLDHFKLTGAPVRPGVGARRDFARMQTGPAHTAPQPMQRGQAGSLFDREAFAARLFEDDVFSEVASKREKLALQMAMAAALTNTPPAAHPAWTYIAGDLKKNKHSRLACERHGIKDPEELEAALGPDKFRAEVVEPAIRDLVQLEKKVRDAYAARDGFVPPVVSELGIQEMSRVYEQLPHLTAVEDGKRRPLSSEGRQALRSKTCDLLADCCLLPEEWERSPRTVQVMLRATLIQLGEVKRGEMYSTNMAVYDHEMREMGLVERIGPVFEYLQHCVENGLEAKEHALALAKLAQIHEMLSLDTGYNLAQGAGAIDTDIVPDALKNYRQDSRRFEMEALYKGDPATGRPGIRDYIMQHCMSWFDYSDVTDGLDLEYLAKWREVQGDTSVAEAPAPAPFRPALRGRGFQEPRP